MTEQEKKNEQGVQNQNLNTLVPVEKYLKTGAHIGTRFKTGQMKKYIYKTRKDGLKVLDVQTLDKRIKDAANWISGFPIEKVVVVSRKLYGTRAAQQFAETTGAKAIGGRFVPGTFSNPQAKSFVEPSLVIVTEPDSDKQAIKEATKARIPILSLCSTNNYLTNIDFCIPVNNKGRKSIALVFWILTREIMISNGLIKSKEEFQKKVEDFEYILKPGEEDSEKKGRRRPGFMRGRRPRLRQGPPRDNRPRPSTTKRVAAKPDDKKPEAKPAAEKAEPKAEAKTEEKKE